MPTRICGARGDRGFEVAGHPHRQFGQPDIEACLEFTPQLTQALEGGPSHGWIVVERGDRHQAIEPQVRCVYRGLDRRRHLVDPEAVFIRVLPGVALQQDRQLALRLSGATVQPPQEFQRIDRLHPVETIHRLPHFIRLQVPDEFPAHLRGIELRAFLCGLLDPVFANSRQPGPQCKLNRRNGVVLRNRQKRYRTGLPASRSTCGFDPAPNLAKTRGKLIFFNHAYSLLV